MPRKTSENEEKKKKNNVAKKTTPEKKSTRKSSKKTTSKKATSTTNLKKNTNKNAKANVSSKKNNAPKKQIENTKKNVEKAKEKVEIKKEAAKKEEIKEKTVIEKIKAFIAKIVAMQEEARLEAESEKEIEKTSEKKVVKKEQKNIPYMLEYYDLPYRYNETVVKILAQTPKRLFVYWDISDKDRQKYLLAFGERFFEETYPVLLVHNEDMNYTFEVPINDFANSWYLDINDPKAKYTIQLGRKFRAKPEKVNIVASTMTESVELHNDYVPIITSNILEVPNDHILFENLQSRVLYRNVKTGTDNYVDIGNLEFAKRMGKIYSIYDIYKEIYKNEIDNQTLTDLLNPSSMSSSKMSSSAFI